jgi:hypothetical protein
MSMREKFNRRRDLRLARSLGVVLDHTGLPSGRPEVINDQVKDLLERAIPSDAEEAEVEYARKLLDVRGRALGHLPETATAHAAQLEIPPDDLQAQLRELQKAQQPELPPDGDDPAA